VASSEESSVPSLKSDSDVREVVRVEADKRIGKKFISKINNTITKTNPHNLLIILINIKWSNLLFFVIYIN
jgi:hypothetical protein